MSTMEKLMESGLDVEFEGFLGDYFISGGEAKKQELRDLVDSVGLKDPTVMKAIGTLQREKCLKPGIYKEFVALHEKLAAGGNGQSAATATLVEKEAPATAEASAEGEESLTEEQIAAHAFTVAQEEVIKKKLEAEEEKMRKRLLARELKIREFMITGKQQRASRLGLKAEDAAKLEKAKEAVKQAHAQIKALREEIKTHRAIIIEIRPKRNVKRMSEAAQQLRVAKRKLTMATNKGASAAELKAAAKVVADWEKKVAAETPAAE